MWQAPIALGFACWILGAVATAVAGWSVMGQAVLIPQPLDELTIALGLWGFLVPVTLAVGLRVFPQFLLLRPAVPGLVGASVGMYAMGIALISAGWVIAWLMPDDAWLATVSRGIGWVGLLAAGVIYIWALGIFAHPSRESVAPHITHPTRLWFRIGYGYLVLGLALGAGFALRETVVGSPAGSAELSAQRHVVTMGYLMPLIVGMAGRILPEFSGEMARHPRVLAALVWLWIAGTALRAAGLFWGGYSGPGVWLMTVGATLAFAGFAWFSIRLWISIGRRRPDAFV